MSVIRLHLLGFTPDHKGLVFSGRRGGRAGTYTVAVDDELRNALEQLEEAREEAARPTAKTKPAAARTKAGAKPAARGKAASARAQPRAATPAPRAESKLAPKEIQRLLREGRAVKDVAARAGVDEAWVERFLGPITYERNGIIQQTRDAFQSRPRLGFSGTPIGEAVVRNLELRRATNETIESLDNGWDARLVRPRLWRVRLRFSHRAKRRAAEWEINADTRAVRARNALARELGWWAQGPGPRPARRAPETRHSMPSADEVDAAAGEGAQAPAEPVKPKRKPARRPARKPAARKPAARKPTARKPTARKPAARKPTARKPAARKPATRKPAARKPGARKATARKPAPRKTAGRARPRRRS